MGLSWVWNLPHSRQATSHFILCPPLLARLQLFHKVFSHNQWPLEHTGTHHSLNPSLFPLWNPGDLSPMAKFSWNPFSQVGSWETNWDGAWEILSGPSPVRHKAAGWNRGRSWLGCSHNKGSADPLWDPSELSQMEAWGLGLRKPTPNSTRGWLLWGGHGLG